MRKMKDLYEKVAADSVLQSKYGEILRAAEKDGKEATKEKLVTFAKEAGFEVTVEEMTGFFEKLSEAKEMQLSDSELDQVAGGKADPFVVMISVVSIGFACALSSITDTASGKGCQKTFEGK